MFGCFLLWSPSSSGRGGQSEEAPWSLPLCSFNMVCELCRVFIASATLAHCIDDLQYWTWQWADSRCGGMPQCLLSFSPPPSTRTGGPLSMPNVNFNNANWPYVRASYSIHNVKICTYTEIPWNRISRVKFEEKQIRVHKKHEKDRKRVENSARKPS